MFDTWGEAPNLKVLRPLFPDPGGVASSYTIPTSTPFLGFTGRFEQIHINCRTGVSGRLWTKPLGLPCRRSANRLASSDYPERWKPRKEPRPPNRSSVRPFVRIFSHESSNTRERHTQVCSNFRVNPHGPPLVWILINRECFARLRVRRMRSYCRS